MDIVIAGGGLAGPLLAQSLLDAGHRVRIVERRTAEQQRSGGYRIHLDPPGDLALRSALPADLYELAVATAGLVGSGVRVLGTDLNVVNELLVDQPADTDRDGRHLTVDRQTLHEVLCVGLGDALVEGVGVDGFRCRDDGRVDVRLSNGHTWAADLLVGADGTASVVRAALVPAMTVIDTGQTNIFGRSALSPDVLADLPPAALDGFATVIGPGGRVMPLAAHRFATTPSEAARGRSDVELTQPDDYLMWVYSGPSVDVPDVHGLEPAAASARLCGFVSAEVGSWNPALGRLVEASMPGSVQPTTVRTSRRPEPWTPGPVTVIGDAAHPMIPAGIGAAVALDDAARLGALVAPTRTTEELIGAVGAYEQEMLVRGFDAVEASERRIAPDPA